MKKSEEIQNEIKKTQEQLANLQKALKEAEESETRVPDTLDINEGDEYCYVDAEGDVCWTSYVSIASGDIGRVNNHRAFLEEGLANIFADKSQFIADLLHFKYLYDKDYKPNWNDRREYKYYVCYDNLMHRYCQCGTTYRTSYNETIYFSSEEIAEKCAAWLNGLTEDKK